MVKIPWFQGSMDQLSSWASGWRIAETEKLGMARLVIFHR
jgi:ribosome modulation factor